MKAVKDTAKSIQRRRQLPLGALKHRYRREKDADRSEKDAINDPDYSYHDVDDVDDLGYGFEFNLLLYELTLAITNEARNWPKQMDQKLEALNLPSGPQRHSQLHQPRDPESLAKDLQHFVTEVGKIEYGECHDTSISILGLSHLTPHDICFFQKIFERMGQCYAHHLLPLILFSRFWLRAPSEFTESNQLGEADQIAALAQHLFTRHEIPRCLQFTWFEFERCQDVSLDLNPPLAQNITMYILLGQGASLHRCRQLFGWNILKKFSGILFQIPSHIPLRQVIATAKMMQTGMTLDSIVERL